MTYKLQQDNENKILQDYYYFFSDPNGIDMLPYAYMGLSSTYDLMIKNNPNYYLFSEEVAIIKNYGTKLREHLSDIEEIVEIGPGSDHTIIHKTIPLLNYAESLKCYYAIDHSKPYLDNACTFLKANTSNIDIIGIEADLISLGNVKSLQKQDFKKCVLFLGGTIGNFSFTLQVQALRQIFQLMNVKDKFILVVDTNQDEKTLLKSYDNIYLYELVKGVLKYFAQINPEFKNYIDFFKICCVWNKNLNLIDIYFQATQDMSFEITNYGRIFISKGQECRGVVSRKTPLNIIKELLYKIGFNILDILNYHGNIQLIICQKPQK